MTKDEIDCGNVLVIATVLWLTSYALQDAVDVFDASVIIFVAVLAILFGRMKND
jgi:hypothetical protein